MYVRSRLRSRWRTTSNHGGNPSRQISREIRGSSNQRKSRRPAAAEKPWPRPQELGERQRDDTEETSSKPRQWCGTGSGGNSADGIDSGTDVNKSEIGGNSSTPRRRVTKGGGADAAGERPRLQANHMPPTRIKACKKEDQIRQDNEEEDGEESRTKQMNQNLAEAQGRELKSRIKRTSRRRKHRNAGPFEMEP